MRTVKYYLQVGLMLLGLLICATAPAEPPLGQVQPDGVERVTDNAQVIKRTDVPPRNTSNAAQQLVNLYSKQWATSADGRWMIVNGLDGGYVGVWDLRDGRYASAIPTTASNGITLKHNPVWDRVPGREDWIYYQASAAVYHQRWGDHTTRREVVKPPAGYEFITNGGEGDIDDAGRYYPVKISTGYSGGYWQGVRCGVVDVVEGRLLEGLIDGSPNGWDVSPDGQWAAYLNHTGFVTDPGNRLYRIADLAQGIIAPTVVDSHVDTVTINGVRGLGQSIGHNGWARNAAGRSVLVYQDNRDDTFKAFDPAAGASKALCGYLDLLGQWGMGQHIARGGPGTTALVSTYHGTTTGSLLLLDVESKAITRVASTYSVTGTGAKNYFAEAFAAVSPDLKHAYWGGNWGNSAGVEVYRVALPAAGGAVEPQPTPIPMPEATPTPAPTPAPAPPVVGDVRPLPDGVPARPEQWFVSAYYQWGVLSGEKWFGPFDQAGAQGKADGLSSRYRRKALVRVPGE